MAFCIPPPSKMDMEGDLRENWTLFKQTWRNYSAATELDKKSSTIQVGTLLSLIGKECLQIFNNIPMTEAERSDPTVIIEKLTQYFEPKQNTIYQRYLFNSSTQEHGERFEIYLHKLRGLIKTCKYGFLEHELLRDRIVIGTNNQNIRARLLSEAGLTLDRAIDICRTTEQAELQLGKLNKNGIAESINYTAHDKRKRRDSKYIKDCKFCGLSHDKGKCQAYGLTCAICAKRNHVANVCQSQSQAQWQKKITGKPHRHKAPIANGKVRYIGLEQPTEEPASSDESIYALSSLSDRKQFYADIHISTLTGCSKNEPLTCKFQIDTGATCSTLALADYKRIANTPLQPSNTRLITYDRSIL